MCLATALVARCICLAASVSLALAALRGAHALQWSQLGSIRLHSSTKLDARTCSCRGQVSGTVAARICWVCLTPLCPCAASQHQWPVDSCCWQGIGWQCCIVTRFDCCGATTCAIATEVGSLGSTTCSWCCRPNDKRCPLPAAERPAQLHIKLCLQRRAGQQPGASFRHFCCTSEGWSDT